MSPGNGMPAPRRNIQIEGAEGMDSAKLKKLEQVIQLAESLRESGAFDPVKFDTVIDHIEQGKISGEMKERLNLSALEITALFDKYKITEIKNKALKILSAVAVGSSLLLTGEVGLVIGALFMAGAVLEQMKSKHIQEEMKRRETSTS
jgi:hypothetical protein